MSERARADAELFDDAMSCHDALPVEFVTGVLTGRRVGQLLERADAMLRTIAQIEDSGTDDADDRVDPAMQRLEAKVNLLLELLGSVVGRGLATPPVRDVRWSRKGLVLTQPDATADGAPHAQQEGLLRLQPAAWLPQILELPVRVIATEHEGDRRLWLRIEPLPATLESALERHLFRQHRRTIARTRGVRDEH